MGADLEAIEAVCADSAPGGLASEQIEQLLERQVDRSLVSIHLGTDIARYSLLENFQVFAQQQLCRRAPDEWEQLVCRHRRYYRDKVVQARNEWFGTQEQNLLGWAHSAWDNLLCAVDRSLATPEEAMTGLEIASGLIALRLPFFIGTLRESRTLAERALKATRQPGRELAEPQISAMVLIGWVSLCQGLPDDAARMLDGCVAACIPDPSARPDLRQALPTDLGLPAGVDYLWGSVLLLTHCDPRAATVLARAREKFTAAGERGGAAMSELFEIMSVEFHGDSEAALEVSGAHLAHAAESGAEWVLAWAKLARAIALAIHGDPDEAAELAYSALSRQAEMKEHWGTTWGVHIRAWILARKISKGVSPARARELALEIAQLAGGATTLRRRVGVDLEHLRPFAAQTERAVETARGVVGEQTFEIAFRAGEALDSTRGEVIRLALGTLSMSEPPAGEEVRGPRPAAWQLLSDAEREVAVLAAAGWTNPAIAARRGSSHRTVDAQLAAILRKLMITSRTDIARLVPAGQRDRVRLESTRKPWRR
ncbi:helix-turn-helix domain-containing protein [Nocardia brevicatena]|uniref:helix-turn-helix domain-containing protein n=1 Tax=Nocardia brevicatena TaxID=37327 RepID=UPI0005932ECA|nr:helix-turn-helix transcriptional regulator [Nocardia brevicatena]